MNVKMVKSDLVCNACAERARREIWDDFPNEKKKRRRSVPIWGRDFFPFKFSPRLHNTLWTSTRSVFVQGEVTHVPIVPARAMEPSSVEIRGISRVWPSELLSFLFFFLGSTRPSFGHHLSGRRRCLLSASYTTRSSAGFSQPVLEIVLGASSLSIWPIGVSIVHLVEPQS